MENYFEKPVLNCEGIKELTAFKITKIAEEKALKKKQKKIESKGVSTNLTQNLQPQN